MKATSPPLGNNWKMKQSDTLTTSIRSMWRSLYHSLVPFIYALVALIFHRKVYTYEFYYLKCCHRGEKLMCSHSPYPQLSSSKVQCYTQHKFKATLRHLPWSPLQPPSPTLTMINDVWTYLGQSKYFTFSRSFMWPIFSTKLYFWLWLQ